MRENTISFKIFIGFLLIVFVSASMTPAFITSQANHKSYSYENDATNSLLSMNIWEDSFNNETKIDPNPPGAGASDNYVVANGQVSMSNTYAAWTNPAWTKMKPITLTNSGGQILINYALQLTITHVSGMQSAYQDIRFKHENNPTLWLDYWIERYNASVAYVWVEIPTIPVGTSTMYLFYGNPSATSQSNFDAVFSWQVNWGDDEKITNHANNEGAWDPDVAYGNGEFFVAWEEGQYTLGFKQEIRASMYDTYGNKLVDDEQVFNDGTTYYRNENPSIDYGGGKYFVAWEHYDTVVNPSTTTEDIKARTVVRNGDLLQLGSVINVCTATNCQADANVQFDSVNNRFCVVWEDARNGDANYNIYGRLYDTNGNPVGSETGIATGTYSQCEPWVAFDPIHEKYLMVWEEGITANNGPFSVKAGVFDENLIQLSTITIATGSEAVDYNFPCVEFSQQTQCFLVTWNQDDISSGDWWGPVWGKIFDASGNLLVNTFQIESGEFVRTDIVPYLSSSFFVSYNSQGTSGSGLIWGKLVSFDGIVSTTTVPLSISSNALADWANLAIGGGRIFTAWEDIRINYPAPWNDNPDCYGNLWWLQMAGSSVSYVIGPEKQLVLTAHVTSIKISTINLNKWNIFNATYTDGTITFNILDGTSGALLLSGVLPGWNLYAHGIVASAIRLKATFTRSTPSTTPKLDTWSVKWEQNEPPNTPSTPSPVNGAIDVSVNADLSWTGGDPNGDPVTYDVYFGTASSPPKMMSNQSGTTYDPGTMNTGTTYYWKIVAWDPFGSSTAGSIWHFTTHNDPPNTPGNPNPAHHANGISITADLSWTGGDPNGDPVTYDVYFGSASSPPKVVSNQSGTTYDPGTMNYNTKYYWRIVAWDNHGASTTGPLWDFTTENRAPNVPTIPNPTNHQLNVSTIVDFSWTGGDPDPGDTVTYDVYFGSASSPPKVVSNQSGTTYDPGTMNYNTKYYWRIVAWDNHGASTGGPLWDFTTCVNSPPYTPSNPSPSNGTINVSVNANLNWNGGDPNPGDIVTYDVYFGTTSPPPIVVYGQSSTIYDPGTMQSLRTYYWKIVAWDNHGASTAGPLWHFTTVYVPNSPPYMPYNPVPSNHATNVSITIDLGWTGGDPNPYDTVTYDVYFGTTSSPPQVVWAQNGTTYDPGTMSYNTHYYWKIVARDNHNASTLGPLWDFTTENLAPNQPSNPDPSDGETDVDVNHDLSWNCSDPNGDPLTYDIYFGTTTPPPLIASGQSNPTYDQGTMNGETMYYWKIVASDNHGGSTAGIIWHFTTKAGINNPPYLPTNPSPANGTTAVAIDTMLSWTGGDPDAGDTVTYDIYFGTTTPPPQLVSNHTSSSYQPTVPEENTTYYWMIVSWDNHNASTIGVIWRFTTELLGDTTPPLVKITKPEKAIYFRNTKILPFIATVVFFAIDVEVNATDNESGVANVEFYINNEFKANDTSAPYSWTWSEKSFLGYTLTVIAYDNAGHHTRIDTNVWKFF